MTRRHFVRLLAAGTLGIPLLKPNQEPPKMWDYLLLSGDQSYVRVPNWDGPGKHAYLTYPIKITVGRNTRTVTHQETPHDFAQALEAEYSQAIHDLRQGIEKLTERNP